MATTLKPNSVIWLKPGDQMHHFRDAPEPSMCARCGVVLDGDPILVDGKEYCGKCGRS